jgi:hypothetical protein
MAAAAPNATNAAIANAMSETERGAYRFSVQPTAHGTFMIRATPTGDNLKGLYGLLGFHLEEGTSLEEAMHVAELMNSRITALTLEK